jgi:hypothetical protein
MLPAMSMPCSGLRAGLVLTDYEAQGIAFLRRWARVSGQTAN